MTESDRLYVEEFATESADLMRRALAYAAQKRAEERARINAVDASTPVNKTLFERLEDERSNPMIEENRKLAISKEARLRSEHSFRRMKRNTETKTYLYQGQLHTFLEISQKAAVAPGTLRARLRADWTVTDAVEKPARAKVLKNDRG